MRGDEYADIPDIKVSGEMLKFAEHIVETKEANFDPSEWTPTRRRSSTSSSRAGGPGYQAQGSGGSGQGWRECHRAAEKESRAAHEDGAPKAPPLQPAMPKARKKARA
jgi:hypothetical protein